MDKAHVRKRIWCGSGSDGQLMDNELDHQMEEAARFVSPAQSLNEASTADCSCHPLLEALSKEHTGADLEVKVGSPAEKECPCSAVGDLGGRTAGLPNVTEAPVFCACVLQGV